MKTGREGNKKGLRQRHTPRERERERERVREGEKEREREREREPDDEKREVVARVANEDQKCMS